MVICDGSFVMKRRNGLVGIAHLHVGEVAGLTLAFSTLYTLCSPTYIVPMLKRKVGVDWADKYTGLGQMSGLVGKHAPAMAVRWQVQILHFHLLSSPPRGKDAVQCGSIASWALWQLRLDEISWWRQREHILPLVATHYQWQTLTQSFWIHYLPVWPCLQPPPLLLETCTI